MHLHEQLWDLHFLFMCIQGNVMLFSGSSLGLVTNLTLGCCVMICCDREGILPEGKSKHCVSESLCDYDDLG